MSKGGVEDRDLGLRRIMSDARRRFPRAYTVGVHDPEIATYAVVHEMRTRFMRDAFENRIMTEVDGELSRLHDAVIAGQDPKPVQRGIAEGFADDYRGAVSGEGLVDTGALHDSIKVVEVKE